MKRLMAAIGLSSAVLTAGFSLAVEPATSPPSAKRQIVECMSKRMSADRAISYNDAMKACKDRVLVGKLALTSNSSMEPAAKSH